MEHTVQVYMIYRYHMGPLKPPAWADWASLGLRPMAASLRSQLLLSALSPFKSPQGTASVGTNLTTLVPGFGSGVNRSGWVQSGETHVQSMGHVVPLISD